MLPFVEFALYSSVDAAPGYTTLYVNGLSKTRPFNKISLRDSGLGGAEVADWLAGVRKATDHNR